MPGIAGIGDVGDALPIRRPAAPGMDRLGIGGERAGLLADPSHEIELLALIAIGIHAVDEAAVDRRGLDHRHLVGMPGERRRPAALEGRGGKLRHARFIRQEQELLAVAAEARPIGRAHLEKIFDAVTALDHDDPSR